MQEPGRPRPLLCLAFVAASRPGPQPHLAPQRRGAAPGRGQAPAGAAPPGARSPPAGPAVPRPAAPPSGLPRCRPRPRLPHPPGPVGHKPGRAAASPAQPLGGGRRAPVAVTAAARPGPPAAPLAERRLAALGEPGCGDKGVTVSRQCLCGQQGCGIQGCIGDSMANEKWSSPLLGPSAAASGALCPVPGSAVKERHGTTREGPEEPSKMTRGLEDLFYKERLQDLGLFCLGKNERGSHSCI